MKRALSRKNLWERLPRAGKAVVGRILGAIPVRLVLGRSFAATLALAEEAEGWPAERARAYQLEELRRILRAAAAAPYYRRLFDSCGFAPEDLRAPEDLARLPTLEKRHVRQHLHEMCAVPQGGADVDSVATGGTGGEPLRFFVGADRSGVEYAHLVSAWRRVGYDLGTPLAVFRGRTVAPDSAGLRHEYDPLLRHHFYSNFHMSEVDMRRYLEHVSAIGPCFLHVYPSAAAALARCMRRGGFAPLPNVRGIIAESEIVYPEQRAMIEDVFACRMFSCYGQSEKVVAAAECEQSLDYHVSPTYGYTELLGEDGKAVTTPGERGEIVGTGFMNAVMPFIRYRTGDHATYVGSRCAECGRERTVVAGIEGHRTQEALVAADGSRITITALNMHDDTFDNVRQYQFFQEAPGRAVLRVVPAAGFVARADSRRILRSLERKLAGRIAVRIAAVDAIALTGRGKATYVDQRIPANAAQDA